MKRQLLSIYKEMLAVAQTPTLKTRIMYKTNQSYTQYKKHLDELLRLGLIVNNSDTYQTTQKGIKFIELMSEIEALLR